MQLTDLVMQADGGRAVDRIAHQFNLSRDQAEAAIEALMPAFSAGIARQTREPQGAAQFLGALGSGRHVGYVDDPAQAFSTEGQAEGVGILGHLFGKKKVSREVTTRAAQQSGLSQGLLKKMLPVLAPIVMGAIVKALTGRSGANNAGLGRSIGEAAGGGLLGTILGSLAEGMMSGTGGRRMRAPQRRRARRTKQRGGGLEDVLGDLMGSGGRNGGGRNGGGLGDLLGGMLGGAPNRRIAPQSRTTRAPRPTGRTAPRRSPAPAGRPGSVFEQLRGEGPRARRRDNGGLFGALTDPGGRTDPAYRREVGSVFDQLLG